MDSDIGDQYKRLKVALITGWTLDYIDSLGLRDYEEIYQVFEAEQSLNGSRSSKPGSKTRTR